MIYKRFYVRRYFKRVFDNVVVPRTTNEIKRKKERFTSKKLVAIQLTCLMLLVSIVTIVLASFNDKEPDNALIPDKTSDINDSLLKLPKSESVDSFETGTRSHPPFYDYPDINVESISKLPVYKYKNEVDTEKLLDSLLDYFNIDRKIYDIKVTKFDDPNNHMLECNIKKDSKLQAIIHVLSSGGVMLTIEDIEKSSIDFNFTPPNDLNEEVLRNYLVEHISKNSDIYNIKIDSIKVDIPFSNRYKSRVYEDTPTSDAEILLDYNGIGDYVSFIRTGNRVLISLRCNETKEFIGYYPIISSTHAEERYRNNDFICYNPSTKELVEEGKVVLSSEDEILNSWLTYIVDENEYIRPIYQITLKANKGDIYFAAVDAIDEKYIQ